MSKPKKTIVLIDDSPSILHMIMSALQSEYRFVPFVSARDALAYFTGGNCCDLILLDVEMPEVNGFDALKLLRQLLQNKTVPVIYLTGRIDSDSELSGLSLGAIDYLYKPLNILLLQKRLELHLRLEDYNHRLEELVQVKTHTIEKLVEVTIATLSTLVGNRDLETGGHIHRTSRYIHVLAASLIAKGRYLDQLTEENINTIKKSAPLHDIGKIGIADSILKKPGKLTPDEFDEMKKHTVIGSEALMRAIELMAEPSFLDQANILARWHHERWDGTGYPDQLHGEQIPVFARIMAIADVYDALISERPYKSAISHQEAVQIILKGAGTHFDPVVCDAFREVSDEFDAIAHAHQSEKTA